MQGAHQLSGSAIVSKHEIMKWSSLITIWERGSLKDCKNWLASTLVWLFWKGYLVVKNEQISSDITAASSFLSSRMPILQFSVLCSSFDLLCPPSLYFKTCCDFQFLIIACSNSLSYLSRTNVHLSTSVPSVSETITNLQIVVQ